jgi:hypothetical protein
LSFFVLGFLVSRNLSTASFSPCTMAPFNLPRLGQSHTDTDGWILGLPT